MALGVVGQKCGMTRWFQEDGSAVPVTVIRVESNRVVQVKSRDTDGYSAIQVATGQRKRSLLTKAAAGHYAKAGVEAGRGLWEFRLTDGDEANYSVGSELGVNQFEAGQFVDVSGTSIGKGFAGVVKRYNFRTQDATHGNSLSHRAPGSIGQNQSPGRVWKGKKMAGHMGDHATTIQNLKVCVVDLERSLLLIKGAVPGAKGGDVVVKPAVKR